jgi:hypothetical protein
VGGGKRGSEGYEEGLGGKRDALREENEALKQDRKKLEYAVYDLIKVGWNKLKRLRLFVMCDVR